MKLLEETAVLSSESMMHRLSLEAFTSSNMIESVRTAIPSLIDDLKKSIGSLTSSSTENTDIIDQLRDKDQKLITSLRTIGFMHFDKELVSVPENFVGNLLQYTKLLIKITEEVTVFQKEMFNQYNVILSAVVTNKNEKLSLQDHTQLFKTIHGKREYYTKAIQKFFGPEQHKVKAPLGRVVARTDEFAELLVEIDKLNKLQASISLDEINTNVTKCVSMLNVLIEQVDNSTNGVITNYAAMNISTGAYEVAKFVEFISILYFDTVTLTKSVSSINELLKKLTRSE